MASHNGKKSFGLRMLWIPGGRKSHPKGRYDSTNKRVPYTTRQKKNENWSLGGSRAQNDLLRAEPDVSLLDGPSTSGLTSLACATASGTAAAVAASTTTNTNSSNSASASIPPPSTECLEDAAQNNASSGEIRNIRTTTGVTTPTTPDSTTSTALLLSAPQSPSIAKGDLAPIDSDSINLSNANTMPAKTHQLPPPVPVVVTATTTAQIIEENRFNILGKDITTNEFDIYTLPSPPRDKEEEHLNNSSGTTASQNSSPHKDHETSSATESHDHHNLNNGSLTNSPSKKKHHHRNHNNNQGDVNSIESITEDTASDKIPSGDLDWIEDVIQDRNNRQVLTKTKKKKKKKHPSAKELDQLDGLPTKQDTNDETLEDEDEKMVKCLYYTLMCCDCTIS